MSPPRQSERAVHRREPDMVGAGAEVSTPRNVQGCMIRGGRAQARRHQDGSCVVLFVHDGNGPAVQRERAQHLDVVYRVACQSLHELAQASHPLSRRRVCPRHRNQIVVSEMRDLDRARESQQVACVATMTNHRSDSRGHGR